MSVFCACGFRVSDADYCFMLMLVVVLLALFAARGYGIFRMGSTPGMMFVPCGRRTSAAVSVPTLVRSRGWHTTHLASPQGSAAHPFGGGSVGPYHRRILAQCAVVELAQLNARALHGLHRLVG